ncbi:lipase family protein [Paenibacillus sp. RC67]|uniref:lipase family protein n=1 Tax=Paenibacillus sp. RC67 TaxID=3039392 RepID=UPI0024AD60CE|nr:lipase family protein [Paenibacillus sp. RC67]
MGEKGKWIADRAVFLSAAVYQAVEQYKNNGRCITPKGFRLSKVLGSKQNPYAGMILQSKTMVIIVFRGTETIGELLADTDMAQVRFPYAAAGGYVHRGFAKLYGRKIRDQVMNELRGLSASKQIWITGHSLGGAVATLCTLDIAVNTSFNNPLLMTFGSPKVGNGKFTAAFSRKIRRSVRVVNSSDLVPVLPPSLKGAEYSHVKGLYRIRFSRSTIMSNHTIRNYYDVLAGAAPTYSASLKKQSPGFLPD